MNLIQHICCRAYQGVFRAALPFLPYREPEILHRCEELPDTLKQHKIKKILIVTDPGIVACGLMTKITSVLAKEKISYSVYDQTSANPTVRNVEEALALYQKEHCKALLAIGGGSPMDAAKGAAARVVHPNTPVNKMAGLLKVRHKIPTFVAVPTTAGTGSETTIAAVITDPETHHKYAIMDLCIVPKYAILDPELTRDLPQKTTSTTGMDALTHAVEAYVCWTYNTKESIRLAEEATVAIFKYLERAYNDGNDMEARQQMLTAAFKAGFAFTRAGVGNVHAIAHTLGGLYNTPHGLANAVILPIVLEDYGEAVYAKLAHLAELTGVKTTGSDEEKAKAFIAEIRAMNKRMNIPSGFDFIKEEDIHQMCQWAMEEANPVYPVPVIYNEKRFTKVIHRIKAEA